MTVSVARALWKVRGTHVFMAWSAGLVALTYLSWAAAWVTLGHKPRPYQDYPSGIYGLSDKSADAFYVGVIALPLVAMLCLLSLVWPLFSKSARWKPRIIEAILGILLFIGLYWFLQWDPFSAADWFFDKPPW